MSKITTTATTTTVAPHRARNTALGLSLHLRVKLRDEELRRERKERERVRFGAGVAEGAVAACDDCEIDAGAEYHACERVSVREKNKKMNAHVPSLRKISHTLILTTVDRPEWA